MEEDLWQPRIPSNHADGRRTNGGEMIARPVDFGREGGRPKIGTWDKKDTSPTQKN